MAVTLGAPGAPAADPSLLVCVRWETAGPPAFCINLHRSSTAETLTSLRLVTSITNTVSAQDLSSLSRFLCSFIAGCQAGWQLVKQESEIPEEAGH